MPVGQFDTPKPNKLITAMQALGNKRPMAINRLTANQSQVYIGTYKGAEVLDANLAIVELQGGATVRFIPTVAGLSLSVGNVVRLEKSSGHPLTVVGKLVGDFTLASNLGGNVTPPGPPTSYAHGTMTSTTAPVTWAAGTDHFGSGLSYNIYVNGNFKMNRPVGSTSATITGLVAGTTYTSYVKAVDGAGNTSVNSNQISFTTSGTPAVPPGTTVTKIYKPTSLRSYNYNGHGELDSWHNGLCYQGDDQNGGWNQVGYIFFDYVKIRADTAGHDMVSCKFTVTYAHWWYNAGGTAVVGTHDYTSIPSVQSGSHGTSRLNITHFHSNVGKANTVSLGSDTADDFQSGRANGIIIGPGLSQSPSYYGYTYGAGSKVPYLTLTWNT